MPFDQKTRNLLQRTVAACRGILDREFTAQLQELYGIQPTGAVATVESLAHLGDEQREVARLLRQRLAHLDAGEGEPTPDKARPESVARVIREQAFTVLNRLAALRLCEERGLVLECVRKGENSEGFQLFVQSTGGGLGEQFDAYLVYLDCLFDEIALDFGVLFDRFSPFALVFPRRDALHAVLAELNGTGKANKDSEFDPEQFATVWREDEAIGWIYQYYNDETERKKMREESSAPRNSRELAVRNQFFTPRYVVEFLTDNTLGRLWLEMTKGRTQLDQRCQYLVRRPDEVFLTRAWEGDEEDDAARQWLQTGEGATPDFRRLGACVNCYDIAGAPGEPSNRWVEERLAQLDADGAAAARRFGTSELLAMLGCIVQKDRFCEGTVDSLQDVIALLTTALTERIANEQSADRSQEELLREPVLVAHRPLKDPREIRLLDPACGSMHFGLYAFDLFEIIYAEAWEIAHEFGDIVPIGYEAFAPFVSFAASFADKAAFLREVPRLIIEHNIHGIDIDPRAAQIAGLSLWLRAQRAWHQAEVKPADRPRITRSNIVCAEPMPGEKELLREFVEGAFPTGERPAFTFLLEKIFDRMALAGEAGSLLRIEEEIRSAIADARALAQRQSTPKQAALFAGTERPEQEEFDLRGLTEEEFWEKAEERIYEALKSYAEQAETGSGFQRRLFADDAAQGFAFIDLCRKRYDVVVMNPPFGLSQAELYEYLNRNYPDSFIDLLASFIVRGETLAPSGFIGAITSRACLYTKTLLDWRTTHMSGRISALADLGIGVLDGAMVRACAYVIPVGQASVNGCFIDARKADDKGAAILTSVQAATNGGAAGASIYCCDSAFFALIPQHRILYWLPHNFWQQLRSLPAIEPLAATIRAGLTTYDDVRFLRLRWEVASAETGKGNTWVFLSKGGYFSTFYNDVHLVVLWANGGNEVGAYNRSLYDTDAQSRRGSAFYLRPAVTYSRRTDYFSARALPENCFFSDKGPCIIPLNETTPAYVLGVFNADLLRGLVHSQSQGGCFETGVLKYLPWSEPDAAVRESVETAARVAWRAKARVFSMFETDARFVAPILANGDSIAACHANSAQIINQSNTAAASNAATISTTVASLFGLTSSNFEDLDVFENDHEIKEAAEFLEAPVVLATAVVSYLVGGAFGRWDIRYATGERPAPELQDPFAALPVCPSGMLQGNDGLPLSPEAGRQLHAAGQYPLDVAWDGILVDDPEHPLDLERRVHAALQVLWQERAGALEHEACVLLGAKSLREWFRRPAGFFADHLKRYSKSRRQAPIYWPLSTASGSYTLWLYYPRLTADTLFRALKQFVEPKLADVEKTLAQLRAALASDEAGTRERRQIEDLEALRRDLIELRTELELWAPKWKPNLNDGVLITAAPLWKLFRLPKWRKDLEACWRDLERGTYDWSHLALTLWPDRVREKCKQDRSLAIAHCLEELCEIKAPTPKAKRRAKPDAAAQERAAQKDALHEQLTEALSNILLGEKIPLDVMNAQTGEIIIPANRKVTKTLLRKLAGSYAHVDVDPSPIRNKIREIIGQFEHKFAELELAEQQVMAMEPQLR